eukprot:TRINITY_DN23555_c0_g1_i2.p1 TRINITY_DN23555_c0_g1~~TRINITY_DN23555_c0_g1_i2.p1  ORF type:complete len:238 (-),score=34.49 TRINITY_DN23555_c0_g1_i2:22-735(-)
MDHTDMATGQSIPCDRSAILDVISSWFGSADEFESYVRCNLYGNVEKQLGRFGFPSKLMYLAMCPGVWGHIDFVCARLRAGDFPSAISKALYMLGWCVGAYPLFLCIVPLLANKLHRKQPHRCLDLLATAAGTACFLVCFCLVWGAWIGCSHLFMGKEIMGGAIFLAMTIGASVGFRWCCQCSCTSLHIDADGKTEAASDLGSLGLAQDQEKEAARHDSQAQGQEGTCDPHDECWSV